MISRASRSSAVEGGADPVRDLRQAEFEIGIAEQEREDLALLLGAQDWQERWGWLSIHY